jgi:hypothetical protein
MDAVAKMVADPVVSVRYHIRANWTNWLPNSDTACPIHIVKNGRFQLGFSSAVNWVDMVGLHKVGIAELYTEATIGYEVP